MSNITTIYDQLLVKLATYFPSKSRIPNPYNLEVNAENFLENGWGLMLGAGIPLDDEIHKFNIARAFSVLLTQEAINTDSNPDVIDSVVKSLSEDVVTLQKDLIAADQIGIESSLTQIQLGDVGEIGTVLSENNRMFLSIDVSFLVQIRENIN